MKQKLLLGLLVVGVGSMLVWSGFTTSQNAALTARVNHLTAALQAVGPTVDLDELEERLASLDITETDDTQVNRILTRIAALEGSLHYPVVTAATASDYMGRHIAVFGRARARVSGAHMFINFEESNFQAPFFNFNDRVSVEDINQADGIVVTGTVGEYQGAPQIIINDLDQLHIGN